MSDTASRATHKAEDAGRQANDSEWMDRAARAGLVAYGVVHVVVGWLALQLAFGDREGTPSQTGAIKEVAKQPFGEALVWAIGVGMFLLVIWQALEAAVGYRDEEGFTKVRKKVTAAGKAVLYAAIGVSAIKVAVGAGASSSSNKQTDSWTAKAMNLPAGQVLVCLVGAAIIGIGGYLVHKAWTEKFRKDLDAEGTSGSTGTAYVWFGKAGYTAKGVALGVVGALFLYAGLTHDPDKSGGLDSALLEVLEKPFGPYLLTLLAVGIVCFGLFCFARARHLSR